MTQHMLSPRTPTFSRRTVLGAALAGVTGIAAAGCTGPSLGGGSSQPASTVDLSKVTPAAQIDFWTVHPGHSQDVEQEIVDAFNASQSATKVRLVTAGSGYADVAQKFQTAQQSKSLPGLVNLSPSFWFNYHLSGAILRLDDLFDGPSRTSCGVGVEPSATSSSPR